MNTETRNTLDAQERARRIHAENIVIDSMAPSVISEFVLTPDMVALAKRQQAEGKKRTQIWEAMSAYLIEHCEKDAATREAYMAYWQRSGVHTCNNTLYGLGTPDAAFEALVAEFGRMGRLLQAMGGKVIQAGTAADIERAWKEGKRAVVQNIQSPDPFGDKFERVDYFYGLGLRSSQLTYNLRTRFGEGCLEPRDGGMSRFGAALVEKMNQVRMIVDVAHASPNTAMDAVRVSTRPCVASHSAARALSGHARALPDEALKLIAERGGYIGVLMLPAFIVPEGDQRAVKLGKPAGWATLDIVVDHVAHIVNLVGEDHVGIGTDWGKPYYNALTWTKDMVAEGSKGFDWVAWRPQDRFDPNMQVVDLETWDKWPNITAALLKRGFSEKTVAKFVGGNFLRVFRDVCG